MIPLRLFLAGSVVLALPIPSFAQKIYWREGTGGLCRPPQSIGGLVSVGSANLG